MREYKPIEWLFRYHRNGYSFFNTNSKDKKISTKWSCYQYDKPNEKEITQWLKSPIQNYAIVCGKISDLTVVDVDTKNGGDPTPFLNRGFYEVRTPSGGYHFYFRYNDLLPSTLQKKNDEGFLKGIDIQSDKKLVFAPPSSFPNGGYTLVNDTEIGEIPDDLLTKMLDSLELEKEAKEYTPFKPIKNPEMGRPGDVFNAFASWEEILIPHGWKKVGQGYGGTQYWQRPGKKSGISGSTDWNDYGLFFCFSTTTDLNTSKGYTKFALYTALNHGGDFNKAAKSLVIDNYKRVAELTLKDYE
jgi:hypothetical protein